MAPRNAALPARAKAALAKHGRLACAVCAWRPPEDFGPAALARCIHLHHVVPLADGGADVEENLVPLCPTHHVVAHALLRYGDDLGLERPPSKTALIEKLRWFDKPREGRARELDARGAAEKARNEQQDRVADVLRWLADGAPGDPRAEGLRAAADLLDDMALPIPSDWRRNPAKTIADIRSPRVA
jgi:hypothetical protein